MTELADIAHQIRTLQIIAAIQGLFITWILIRKVDKP